MPFFTRECPTSNVIIIQLYPVAFLPMECVFSHASPPPPPSPVQLQHHCSCPPKSSFVSFDPRISLRGDEQIHTRGARRLARALRSNGSLVSLLLRSNLVGDDGAELLVASIPHAESLGELE